MAINGETIKSAITKKLSVAYPTTSIRKETIMQGSDRPYFYVSQLNMTQIKEKHLKYVRLYQMKITYQTAINDPNTNKILDGIGEALMELLTTIDVEVGGEVDTDGSPKNILPVYGTQMDYKRVDDEAQIFVSYVIKVYDESLSNKVLQQQLTVNTSING